MITTIETTEATFCLDYTNLINEFKVDVLSEDPCFSKVIAIRRRLRSYNVHFENGLTVKIPNHQVIKIIIL